MPQSSLTAWLNQPKAVKEPPAKQNEIAARPQPTQLPTPPQDNEIHIAPKDSKTSSNAAPFPFSKPLRPLPSNVELRPCTKDDIPHLKRLTSLLLPIPYPEKFYKEIIEDPLTSNIALLAVWHEDPSVSRKEKGRLVGAIRCRLLGNQGPMLYLSTLVLLSPYRSHGIATHLLHTLTVRAVKDYGITSVGAHVWEANAEGLEWYRKRGFREVNRETGYYRRLDPQTAVVMQRDVGVMDLLREKT